MKKVFVWFAKKKVLARMFAALMGEMRQKQVWSDAAKAVGIAAVIAGGAALSGGTWIAMWHGMGMIVLGAIMVGIAAWILRKGD